MQLQYVTISKIEKGIINVIYNTNQYKITLDIAKIVVAERIKMCNYTNAPLLIEGSTINSIDKDARNYFSKGYAVEYISACAIITENAVNNYLVNFFLKINAKRTPFPVKLFTDRIQAIEWLKNFC